MLDYEKIRQMVQSDNASERFQAIIQIQFNLWKFTDTDKEQVWKDLLALTKDKDCDVRDNAASALSLSFQYVDNKKQAWNDLLGLINDKDFKLRWGAASALGQAFVE